MKKKAWKRALAFMLASLFLYGAASCQPTEEYNGPRVLTDEEISAIADKIPDYSDKTDQFDFWAYQSTGDGYYTDGAYTFFGGEDFRNLDRVKEYKDSGLTVFFPQSPASVDQFAGLNFNFEASKLKEMMDMTVEAGLSKFIVTDYRLYTILNQVASGSLIGEGKLYATEEELDELIKQYLAPYVTHEAFYGLQLLDEPQHAKFTALGDMYKSIQRCYPGTFVIMNLMPPMSMVERGETGHFPQPKEEEIQVFRDMGYSPIQAEQCAAFSLYLNQFLDETGADYIMYDQYPLRKERFDATYVSGMQVAAQVAKERNVDFYFVSETFSYNTDVRFMSNEDLRYLNNMSLGFGIKKLAYYTYFQAGYSEFEDYGSFLTRLGKKTDIYYNMQKILAENQAFAPVILNYDYVTSGWYIKPLSSYNSQHVSACMNGTFTKIASFENDKESTFISELYDDEKDLYMYMIQNAIDPAYKASTTYQTVTVKFNTDYLYAVVWKNGERTIVKLKDNTYQVEQQPGEAVYVIPFNA